MSEDPKPVDNGNKMHGVVPLLGNGNGSKPKIGTGMAALVRRLDKDGTYTPSGPSKLTPQGVGLTNGREDFCSAEDLVEMIRVVVREEIQAALKG